MVKGFIAAMHQWEKECNRIQKAHPNSPVTRLGLEAMQTVFDEFCTAKAKDRKYGRFGSFSTPPEYNPRTQKVVEVRPRTSRRVDVDTQEARGFKRLLTYVVLKKLDGWRIDSRKGDGKSTYL